MSKFFKLGVDNYYNVKVVGTPIGTRQRVPIDGDGDGFYSPFPGAPDKTPVPFKSIDKKGLARIIGIRDEMIRKYGRPKTVEEAEKALKKVFPNIKISEEDKSRKLTHSEQAAMLGLLGASELFPSIKETLTSVEFDSKDDEYPNMLGIARTIGFNVYQIGFAKSIERLMGHESGRSHTITSKINNEAIKERITDKDRLDAIAMGVAIHEAAHVQHYSKIVQHLGGKDLFKVIKNTLGLSRAEVKKQIAETRAAIEKYREQLKNATDEQRELLKEILRTNERSEEEMLMGIIRGEINEVVTAIRAQRWDGLDKEQERQSRDRMMSVSRYAEKDAFEAVAESLSAVALGFPVRENPMHEWLMGKSAKKAKDDIFQICSGYTLHGPSD